MGLERLRPGQEGHRTSFLGKFEARAGKRRRTGAAVDLVGLRPRDELRDVLQPTARSLGLVTKRMGAELREGERPAVIQAVERGALSVQPGGVGAHDLVQCVLTLLRPLFLRELGVKPEGDGVVPVRVDGREPVDVLNKRVAALLAFVLRDSGEDGLLEIGETAARDECDDERVAGVPPERAVRLALRVDDLRPHLDRIRDHSLVPE